MFEPGLVYSPEDKAAISTYWNLLIKLFVFTNDIGCQDFKE